MFRRIFIGVLFLLLGIGILFHQIELWNFRYILKTWWPLILIIIGIEQLINRKNESPVGSLMIILIGGLFLLNQWININLTAFIWPIIFIFIGLVIIFTRKRFKHENILDSNHSIEAFALFAGTNLRSQSKSFQGGNVLAIFGGSEIDLRETVISNKGAVFDLTTVFGGITIIVPENVHVEISGLPIFGGWEDKTRGTVSSDDTPVIKINCLSIFGGVEIKD